jgi:hypothetical protein
MRDALLFIYRDLGLVSVQNAWVSLTIVGVVFCVLVFGLGKGIAAAAAHLKHQPSLRAAVGLVLFGLVIAALLIAVLLILQIQRDHGLTNELMSSVYGGSLVVFGLSLYLWVLHRHGFWHAA